MSFLRPIAITSLITFGLLEFSLQALLRTNTLKIHGVLQYPNISRAEFNRYMSVRDAVLGWPSELAHGRLYNKSGYRPSPESSKHGVKNACVAVFGDSQGYGLDVDDSQAWTNILARELGCRVENYSVPAYGTDQALLRFEKIKPKADVALLTFIDDNIRRNLLQYWDLAYGPIYMERTKPRFVLSPFGRLELIGLPINTFDQVQDLNYWRFGELFKNETFAPSSRAFATAFQPSFPFSFFLGYLSLRNIATKYRQSPWVLRTPLSRLVDRRMNPVDVVGTGEALNLQAAILQRFADRCSGEYKKCLILRLQPNFVNPSAERGSSVRAALEGRSGIRRLFIPGEFMAGCVNRDLLTQGGDPVNLDRRMPGGHYGPETNRAFGRCVGSYLKPLLK